jgi:hypothetical protein
MDGFQGVDGRSLPVFRDCDIIDFTVLFIRGGATPAIVNGVWLACELVEKSPARRLAKFSIGETSLAKAFSVSDPCSS